MLFQQKNAFSLRLNFRHEITIICRLFISFFLCSLTNQTFFSFFFVCNYYSSMVIYMNIKRNLFVQSFFYFFAVKRNKKKKIPKRLFSYFLFYDAHIFFFILVRTRNLSQFALFDKKKKINLHNERKRRNVIRS